MRDVFDPFTVRAQAGTSSGFVRTAFPGRLIPATRFDTVAGRLIQAYPLPDRPGLTNNHSTNPVHVQDWDQGDARVDWTGWKDTTLFGRFSRQDTFTQPPSTFGLRQVPGVDAPLSLGADGTFAGNSNLVAHHAVIAGMHVFSPTLLLDARMGYGRFNLHHLKVGADEGAKLGEKLGIRNSNQGPFSNGVPIVAPSGYTGIGGPQSLPTIRLENTFNPVVNLTKVHGNHSFKFGMGLIRRHIIDFQTNRGDGRFNFDRTYTSDPNNTGATGENHGQLPAGDGVGHRAGLPAGVGRNTDHGDWVVRAGRLEGHQQADLKYGSEVRVHTAARGGRRPLGQFRHPDREDADRRLQLGPARRCEYGPEQSGAAVRLRLSVAAGHGGARWLRDLLQHTGERVGGVPAAPAFAVRADQLEDINQFNANPRRVQDGFSPIPPLDFKPLTENPVGSFNAVPQNYKTGYAQQFNFGMEQEIPRWGLVVKGAYVGNLARQVDSVFNINNPDPDSAPPAQRRLLRNVAPNLISVSWGDTTGVANYHSLQMSAEKRFSSTLGFISAYTWSHSIDNVPLQQGGGSDGPVPQDIRYRFLDRGTSGFI